MLLPGNLVNESFCYLTTTGRKSGEPREIEIWFGASDNAKTLYLMAGGREKSHWVRNLDKTPAARLRVGAETFDVIARRVGDPGEEALARKLLLEKYAPTSNNDLSDWGRTALPIALDLQGRVEA
jgi:deazaflavin-dependent oxidoreductase (nitroreductase family)